MSAEGAAIIASILLAFAIDAWWDGVKADRDTQEILDAVLVEMESNLTSLHDSITHHGEIVEAIKIALEQSSIAGLLDQAVIDVEVFEPSTGALDTLIATGMLAAIDEPALQISLGGFNRLASDLNERESRAVEFRDAARRRIAAIGDPIWNRVDSDRIQADIRMLNLLTMRQAEERAAIESAQMLERHLRVLIRQLDPDT
jgi:hypothetical protein